MNIKNINFKKVLFFILVIILLILVFSISSRSAEQKFTIQADLTPPTINLTSPIDYYNTSSFSIIFNTTVYDNVNVTNVTLYSNWTGTWVANFTNSSGLNNSAYLFNIKLNQEGEGYYKWGIRACDNSSLCKYSENRTFTIDRTSPNVTLVFPKNNTNWTSSSRVDFTYNVTDNSTMSNCSLIINSIRNQTDYAITNDINQTFSIVLNNASYNYNWSVNCTDPIGNIGNSSTWQINVDVGFVLNSSLPENVTSNQTMSIIAEFYSQDGYFGNYTLETLSNGSKSKNLSFYDESVWVIDTSNNQVVKLSSNGTELVRISGFNSPATTGNPISVNSNNGNVWVADKNNNQVVKLSSNGTELVRISGFTNPFSISVYSTDGSVWVAERGPLYNQGNNDYVIKLNSSGTEIVKVNGFKEPLIVSVNSNNGNVWVADDDNYANTIRIIKLNSSGSELLRNSVYSGGYPDALSVNSNDGSVWITYSILGVYGGIRKYTSDGTELFDAYQNFKEPRDLSVNSNDGSVWVADTSNHQVVKLSSNGTELVRISGFNSPSSIAIDYIEKNNVTVYFNISKNANVSYAVINLTGDSFHGSYPANITLDVGNDSDFQLDYSGTLNTTNKTANFSAEVDEYLSTCTQDIYGDCQVPLVFYSDSGGILNVSNINVTYEYNESCWRCVSSDGTCDTEWTINNVTTDNFNSYKSGNCSFFWNTTNYDDDIYNISFRLRDINKNIKIVSKQITLDRYPPTINLHSPEANGGDEDGNVTFIYGVNETSLNITNCSLIFNHKLNQSNSSILVNKIYNFTINKLIAGTTYNWSINCTDIFNFQGASGSTRNITIISTDNFTGGTDLTTVNISNISHFTLETPNYGKINFSGYSNLSGISDINSYIKIRKNYIEINSSALPKLNKSALITFYNLTYTTPGIKRNGVICPSRICKEISYTNNKYTVNISEFSYYEAYETSGTGVPSEISYQYQYPLIQITKTPKTISLMKYQPTQILIGSTIYMVTILGLTETSTTIRINPELTLEVGETKIIVIDNTKISITLDKIQDSKAYLLFELIEETKLEEKEVIESKDIREELLENDMGPPIQIPEILIILALIGIIIFYFYHVMKKD